MLAVCIGSECFQLSRSQGWHFACVFFKPVIVLQRVEVFVAEQILHVLP